MAIWTVIAKDHRHIYRIFISVPKTFHFKIVRLWLKQKKASFTLKI